MMEACAEGEGMMCKNDIGSIRFNRSMAKTVVVWW